MKLTRLLFGALGFSLALSAQASVLKTVAANAADVSVVIKIIDSADGTPETGVVFNTSGIDIEYWRHGANSVTDITEATQTTNGAHTDGGFVHLGNGYYRLDLPDATVASGADAVEIMGTVTGMIVIGGSIQISPNVNVASASSGSIDNADFATAPGAAGGIAIAGTNADFNVTAQVNFLDGLDVARSTSNTSAITATGNGTGNGATFTSGSGATGNGLQATAASTNGSGFGGTGTGSGHGFLGTGGSSSGSGFLGLGGGTGSGLAGVGGANGHGVSGVGGATSGVGIRGAAAGGNSNGAAFFGAGTGHGVLGSGGNGATGNGAQFTSNATNGSGIGLTPTGSGVGIDGTLLTVTTATTATNLTNAPTNGDLTATMKTSVQTAAAAAINADTGDTFTAIPDVDTLLEALVVLGARQTADSGTTTTIVDAALTQATNDWFRGMGVHFVSGTLAGQDACATGFTAASDTLTFAPAVTTAVTTHQYYLLPDSECFSGASGSGATAQEVWEYATRALTILDEDSTTLDLNNTTVGALTTFDEDTTTIDINATTIGTAAAVTAISSGGINEASYATTAGPFAPLGITDQGTAQSATSTTLVLRAATPFSSDDANRGQTLWAFGSDQGYWQSETITAFATASDTATVNTWDVTPTGTITYRIYGTAETAAGAGGGATAQEVWEYGTRFLTSLDEDLTTIDLNATTIGTLATLDEDTTTLDLNATTIGTVTTATNVTTVNGLAAGVITAASVGTGAIDADSAAADLSTEIWAAATRSLTILDEDSTTLDLDASTIGTATNVGATSVRTAVGLASANLDTQLANIESGVDIDTIEGVDATDSIDARLLASLVTTQGILTGTCDSGSTTTCVDDALTQAATSQIDDHLICFPTDSFCAMVTDFTPGTDTVTITKTAPSTRASKTYVIWPSTLQ